MLTLTSVFHKNAEAWKKGYQFIVNQGGTSSSKTFSILQLLTLLCYKHPVRINITAESVPHLKRGVLVDMENIFSQMDVKFDDYYQSNDRKLSFGKGVINFPVFPTVGSAHGGRCDVLFINEANNIPWEIAAQLIMRTKRGILDYNPTRQFWAHDELINKLPPDKVAFFKSTYLDNEYLHKNTREYIESRRGDGTSNFWRVYGLGELGIAEGLVFDNWEVRDFDRTGFSKYRYGVDWGFSQDPFAFVEVAISGRNLYVCNEVYAKELLNEAAAAEILPICGESLVRCDNAEPKSVQDFVANGVNAIPAKKGKGSVETGTKHLQGFNKIIIHPSCRHTADEFRNHQWKKDRKTGAWLPEAEKGFDHAIDAIRYALEDDVVDWGKSIKTESKEEKAYRLAEEQKNILEAMIEKNYQDVFSDVDFKP